MIGIRNKIKKAFLKIHRELSGTSIQKRLGYPESTKLLIIHADDMGLSVTENSATIEALKKGMVNSGSIMVPCRAYQEITDYVKNHPEFDAGIHLTLTCEWDTYKWGPVLPPGDVKSLVDTDGFFFKDNERLMIHSSPADIENELRAQIKSLIDKGVDITHIDSHMFISFSPKVLKICAKLGKDYKLPVLLTKNLPLRYLTGKNVIIVDGLYYAKPEHYSKGLDDFYSKTLNSLKPGLNCILVHLAFDNEEMQNIASGQKNYGSEWRNADFNYFTGDECRRLIKENEIQLITWREIRDKLLR
jgi:predicted glycoside hydrolase/deacetylase ChbG (UPF0249 family)